MNSRTQRTKLMIVVCGLQTHTAAGLSAEISIAREVNTPYLFVTGARPNSARIQQQPRRRTKCISGFGKI